MSNLEKAIRDAIARGELTYLALKPHRHVRGQRWEAFYRGASEGVNGLEVADDPVDALTQAVAKAKKGRRRAAVAEPEPEPDFG